MVKWTFIFTSGRYGWSESWYQSLSDIPLTLPTEINEVAFKSAAIRSVGVVLKAIRCSMMHETNKSFLFLPHPGVNQIWPSSPNLDNDLVNTSLAVAGRFTNTLKSIRLIRGLPDSEVSFDDKARPVFSGWLRNAVNAYFGAVKIADLRMRSIVRAGSAPQFTPIRISLIKPTALNNTTATLILDGSILPAPVVGDLLQFKGKKIGDQLAGFPLQAEVLEVKNTGVLQEIVIPYRMRSADPFPPAGAYVYLVNWNYPGLISWELKDFRSRATGRPFDLRRGRRPTAFHRQ